MTTATQVVNAPTAPPAPPRPNPSLSAAVIEALAIGNLPDVQWVHGDDLCDCTYQRIGMWKNPYLAETLEVRLCCVWGKLAELYPDMVRAIPAYWLDNEQRWDTVPHEWNGETDMPPYLWYRHLARKLNRPLSAIRAEYKHRDAERPRGVPRIAPTPVPYIPFVLLDGTREIMVNLGERCDE